MSDVTDDAVQTQVMYPSACKVTAMSYEQRCALAA